MKKWKNVKHAKNHDTTSLEEKPLKPHRTTNLKVKKDQNQEFATQLVALPICMADPFQAAKISIMAMFETSVPWLGNIILMFLR